MTRPAHRGAHRATTSAPAPVRALSAAPDRLVMLLFWTCLVAGAAVLLDQFRPVLVLPVLLVVLAVTWRLVPRAVPATRATALGALGAVCLATGWVVVNLPYASQYVVVNRDPGFLTLEGLWLSEHASAGLPASQAAEVAGSIDGITAGSALTDAFTLVDGQLYAQGAKLLPALLGMLGWAGGDRWVLAGNLVIGAFALIAVYGLARRLLGPVWALVPLIALAVSMPMIAFSRSAYTEPLTMLLIFGGLTMSRSAFETRSWWRHLLAGSLIGANALARIDGSGAVIGLLLALMLVAALPIGPRNRARARNAGLLASGGALVMVALGYLDLRWHSPTYLADLSSQFTQLVLVLLVAVGLTVAVPRLPLTALRRSVLRHRGALSTAVGVLVLATGAALAARPLWQEQHDVDPTGSAARLVRALQVLEGIAVDMTRSYDEWSLHWVAWYLGWPTVVLALVGGALLVRRAFVRRDPRLLVLLGVIGAPSFLYLWKVSITPDQIWAVRRLLAVTFPGFLVLAVVPLRALWATRSRWWRTAAAGAATAVAVLPATTWGELFTAVEQDGRYDEAIELCDALQGRPVVYVRGASGPYLPTIRTLCGSEVVVTDIDLGEVEPELLQEIRAAWGDQEVMVVTFEQEDVPWADAATPAPFSVTASTVWPSTLGARPSVANRPVSSLWVGIIDAAGTVVPVGADGTALAG
ncbi:MAG TPA: hypothetical protein VGC67_14015 [Cellulomonas sp.]